MQLKLAIGLLAVLSLADPGRGAESVPEALLAAVQREVFAEDVRDMHERRRIEESGVELGPWYRIGPFRDQGPRLNWMENVAFSFAFEYAVEKDLRQNDWTPLLPKEYSAPSFPATPNAVRRWRRHDAWIDGYLCDLPRGPPPSTGETQYVYRALTAEKPVTVELDFVIRSPQSDLRWGAFEEDSWKRLGRFVCWLNGREILRFDKMKLQPGRVRLALETGVNSFVAKITNNRHSYGFSFAISGLQPAPERMTQFEQPWREFHGYGMVDLPHFREADDPSRCVSGANWWEALFASAEAYRKRFADPTQTDIVIADFEGPDYGDWMVAGEAFGARPAQGTLPNQMEVSGYKGKGLVNTYLTGDRTVGTLTSPPIKIERKFVNLLVGGGGYTGQTCINLVVDGKIVRTAAGPNTGSGGSEALDWHSWDVSEFAGRDAVIQIVDQYKGSWGHINVDQISLSDRRTLSGPNRQEIWSALKRSFADTRSGFEIELTKAASSLFWDSYLRSGDRSETERALADYYLTQLAAVAGKSPQELSEILEIAPGDKDYAHEVRHTYFTACHYRESLIRLKSFRHIYAPMPGIEAAARDSRGRIVTQMEKALAGYPESNAGRTYRLRVEALGSEVDTFARDLLQTGKPDQQRVLALNCKLDDLWDDTIRSLPPLLFLERPVYRYDSMQFTDAGQSPSYIRVFDPKTKQVRDVYHTPSLRAHDINLSWDAKTVLVGGGGRVQAVDIYGKGYRVITSGQSPAELPDGRIVFFDDEPGQSPCKATGSRRLLFICDPDGTHRKLASANLTIDNHPQILGDGRVVFARWDYGVNKNVFNRHGIWVQNPDGTELDLFFGNTIIDPLAFYRPRQIPNRPEVVTIFGTHHHSNAGLVGLIWQGAGREAADGVGFERISRDMASVGDFVPIYAYQDPFPLNEQLFLVSYGGGQEHKVGMYLLDRFGNRKCIFESARGLGVYCPQPLQPRSRPPVIPDRATVPEYAPADLRERLLSDPDWSQTAALLLQDVYQGIEPEIERGRAKYLAVMEQVPQDHPRGGAIGVGTIFYVNRLVGLVPLKPDGSAYFEVPAARSLYLHVLDKDGKMLMTQGSDFHVMPGETRSCLGCHEQRRGIAFSPKTGKVPIAASNALVRPRTPEWGTNGIIEYEAVVQPVFDKYCVSCHSGLDPDGRLDLSASRTTVYNMSYMELTDKALVHFTPGTGRTPAQPTNDYDEQSPLSRGTLLSRLTPYLENPDHCGKAISWDERYRVYCWIDSNVPFYSHYRQLSSTVLKPQAREALADVHKRRCANCHNQRLRKDAASCLTQYHQAVHVPPEPGQWGIAESGMRVRHLNLSHPEHSAALLAPLSEGAGGWSLCSDTGVFKDKGDPDYQRMREALSEGVVHRDQPGVAELLRAAK